MSVKVPAVPIENKDFPTIILIEPSKPQNLGSIARVMMNFGYSRLILLNPQVNLSDSEISVVSRRAHSLLNQATIKYQFKEVREEFDYLIGTTARIGHDYNLSRVSIDIDQLKQSNLPPGKFGLIFGREQFGLKNEEISQCDLLITIPTESTYSVMNLSHAAAIVLFVVRKMLFKRIETKKVRNYRHRASTYDERQHLINYYENLLSTVKYHPEKQRIAIQAFENILSRGYITGREVTTLMGVFKWIHLNLK